MSLTTKLQTFSSELENKILDPDFQLENSLILLQIAAYIKTLLGTSTSGGSGSNNAAELNNILAAIVDFQGAVDADLNSNTTSNAAILAAVTSFQNAVNTDLGTNVVQLGNILTSINNFQNTVNTDLDAQVASLGTLSSNLVLFKNAVDLDLDALYALLGAVLTSVDGGVIQETAINTKLVSTLTKLDSIITALGSSLTNDSNILAALNTVNLDQTTIINRLNTLITNTNTLIANSHVSLNMTSSSAIISTNNAVQQIVPADANRRYLCIQNNSDTNNVFIGFANNVTATTGIRLPISAVYENTSNCIYKGAIWALKTSGNGNISITTGVAA